MRFAANTLCRLAPAAAVVLALLSAAGPMAGALRADTFSVIETSWGSATTAGTLAWAIDQANTSSATGNVISIASNLLIDVDGATAIDAGLDLAQFTRSVTIEGNGAKLVGNPTFVTTGGQTVTKYNPDRVVPSDTLVTPGGTTVALSLRYPLMGGWKVDFVLGECEAGGEGGFGVAWRGARFFGICVRVWAWRCAAGS